MLDIDIYALSIVLAGVVLVAGFFWVFDTSTSGKISNYSALAVVISIFILALPIGNLTPFEGLPGGYLSAVLATSLLDFEQRRQIRKWLFVAAMVVIVILSPFVH